MGDLTRNLSRHELACKCGCGADSMDWQTVEIVQDICDEYGCSVLVNSAHRCLDHNQTVGSSPDSQHLKARAMDCVFSNVSPTEVHRYLCKKYPDRFGFGVYRTFNHIDSRTGFARWTG